MAAIEFRAPGKLAIAGEYAVLAGAAGIAVAVDRQARARITPRAGRTSQLMDPLSGARFGFRWVLEQGVRWEGPSPGSLGLPLEAVAGVLMSRAGLPPGIPWPACSIELDTREFHAQGAGGRVKLGLGSSAAVIVTLTGALLRQAGDRRGVPGLLPLCWEAHRRLQGGEGSGMDVATCLLGGVVAVSYAAPGTVPGTTPLPWPEHLHVLPVWTGTTASTPALLARFNAFRDRHPAACSTQMAGLTALSGRVLTAWRGDDPGRLLAALAGYGQSLRRLDAEAGIGIFSPEHQRLAREVEALGAVYKPSGAGGGDFGLVFCDSAATVDQVRSAVEAAGFTCLDSTLGAPGLSPAR